MTDIDAALNRQEQIWAGLYGPSKARQLVEDARSALAGASGSSIQQAVADIQARLAEEDEDDLDEAGTMRPI